MKKIGQVSLIYQMIAGNICGCCMHENDIQITMYFCFTADNNNIAWVRWKINICVEIFQKHFNLRIF